MTPKEFLQEKYPQMRNHLWNSNPNIDDEWVARMMNEYHKSEVEKLNIHDVSKSLCPKCESEKVHISYYYKKSMCDDCKHIFFLG